MVWRRDLRIVTVFTYRENRVLFLENGSLTFPCAVSIRILLDASPVLGDDVPGLTFAAGERTQFTWNANTGRSLVVSNPPLPFTELSRTVGGIEFTFKGHEITALWTCTSRDELVGVLGALHFVLPLSLTLEFLDPVDVAVTCGQAGEVAFVWQVERSGGPSELLPPSERDARLLRALDRLPALSDVANARLLAASAYFHNAVRLLALGQGPSEFAGEAVVDLAKVLEVLFPGPPMGSRDKVRAGLIRLGYDPAEIESTMIPCLILRSNLDAAHVRMANLAADERRQLQRYLEAIVGEFRKLMLRIVTAVLKGSFTLDPYEDERSAGDELSKLINHLGTAFGS
jgi:hypothetical protein